MKEKIFNKFLIMSKVMYLILTLLFALPSIIFWIKNKTLLNLAYEKKYFLTDTISYKFQALTYCSLIVLMVILYLLVIKYRNQLFKSLKQSMIYIAIISAVYLIIVPFWCSDIFYYLGVGRLSSTYMQNPYYVTMFAYICNNGLPLPENDTAFLMGYNNFWTNTTVVYGPIEAIICGILGKLSLGNIDLGILVFKIFNNIVHNLQMLNL